jgi:futalosine hydrolase
MRIAIFYSVPFEGKIIQDFLIESKTLSNDIVTGRINNHQVITIVTGVGKVNAAHVATLVIERYKPEMLISTGIGGAYPPDKRVQANSELGVGDIAIATEEIYGDEGVICRDGFKDMTEIGLPLIRAIDGDIYNRIALDNELSNKVYNIINKSFRCQTGAFITLSSCSGTIERAKIIKKLFNGLCENMEGAAIAHISKLYGLGMVEIRGISNIVEDRNREAWDIPLASKNVQEAVIKIIQSEIFVKDIY